LHPHVRMRRLRRGVRQTWLATFAMSWAAEALACPNCASARAVRASVYDASFWSNLALVVLPLLVLMACCRQLYRIGLKPGRDAANEAVDP